MLHIIFYYRTFYSPDDDVFAISNPFEKIIHFAAISDNCNHHTFSDDEKIRPKLVST